LSSYICIYPYIHINFTRTTEILQRREEFSDEISSSSSSEEEYVEEDSDSESLPSPSSSSSSSMNLISIASTLTSSQIVLAVNVNSVSTTLYCISSEPPYKIKGIEHLDYVPFRIVPSKSSSDKFYVCGDGYNIRSYNFNNSSTITTTLRTKIPASCTITCLDLNEKDEIRVAGSQLGTITCFNRTRTYDGGPICDVKEFSTSSCLIASAGYVYMLVRDDDKPRAMPGLRANQVVTCICVIGDSFVGVGTHDGCVLILKVAKKKTSTYDEEDIQVFQTLRFAEPVYALSSFEGSCDYLIVVTARRVHLYSCR